MAIRRRAPGELSRSPPRAHPGHLRDDEQDAENDDTADADPQWWDDDAAFGKRNFAGFISRQGNERFERLYADSASRLVKLSRKQEDAVREKLDRENSYIKTARKVAAEDVAEACDRMHNEAEKRRLKMEKKRQEQQYLEDLHEALRVGNRAQSTPNLVREPEPHWERLHARASEKTKKFEREKQIREEEEQKKLERLSIHRKSDGAEASSATDRLYNDGLHREWRREQRRLLAQESEREEFQNKSVHQPDPAGVAGEEAAQRLYAEGKLREQRLVAQRKLKEEQEQKKTGKVAHAKVISRRINLLYGDAERRRADRALMEEEYEKEVLVDLLKDSVHEHVRANPAGELERIIEKSERKPEKDIKATARDRTPRAKQPDADFQLQRSPSAPSHGHGHGHGHGHCHGHGHGNDHAQGGRRAKPGDIDDLMGGPEFMPYGQKQALSARSPRRQPSQNRARSAGGQYVTSSGRSGQRVSAILGPPPFEQLEANQHAVNLALRSEGPRSVSNPKERKAKPEGPFVMTHLVEDGAKQSLSARLPVNPKGPVRADFVREVPKAR